MMLIGALVAYKDIKYRYTYLAGVPGRVLYLTRSILLLLLLLLFLLATRLF